MRFEGRKEERQQNVRRRNKQHQTNWNDGKITFKEKEKFWFKENKRRSGHPTKD